jgi:hypothetical protein
MQLLDQLLNRFFFGFLLFLFRGLFVHIILLLFLFERGQIHIERRQEVGFRVEWFLFIGHVSLPVLEIARETGTVSDDPANPKRAVIYYSRLACGRSIAGQAVHLRRCGVDEQEQRFQPCSKPGAARAGMGEPSAGVMNDASV